MSHTDAFLARIDAFLLRTGMGQARFGDLALNDRSFVDDVRQGRDLRASTISKVDKFMADWDAEHGSGTAAA
jgi:aspartate carbamoyltransferase catalytic subunit